jgi:hypothetical protein
MEWAVLSQDDSRRLALALSRSDLGADERARAARAAVKASRWSDLPAWLRAVADQD